MLKMDLDSRFLYAEDFLVDGVWREYEMTIKKIGEKDSIKSEREGVIIKGYPIEFEETDKILVVRATNIRLIKAQHGTGNIEKLVGQKITLYPALLDQVGADRDVPCLRVRVDKNKVVPKGAKMYMGRDLTGTEFDKGLARS